jgi:hypothetical protein
LIVDFRKQRREHSPIQIKGTAVERVSRFKFVRVHITEDLTDQQYYHSSKEHSNISTSYGG